jgi:hypothetical protein
MVSIRMRSVLLAVMMGLGAVFVSIGVLGMSPAQAHELELTGSPSLAPAQPPPPDDDDLGFVALYFTEPLTIQITDLSGNVVGEGVHGGEVRCNRNNCSQTTQLIYTIPLTDWLWSEYEYKFTTRQAIDPVEERVVVGGTGTISSRGQKERFSFTAVFQNNRDGTVWVRYEASRPDASFIIPAAPGTFSISSRR